MNTERSLAEIGRQIKHIDWDFPGALSQYSVHRLHWYPATFVPQIPAYLIELFSNPGDLVYDPFCGIGTTLVEAIRLGRRTVGTDVNFIATLVARAKTSYFEPPLLRQLANNLLQDLQSEYEKLQFTGYSDFRLSCSSNEHAIAAQWYHEKTFQELLVIWNDISRQPDSFRIFLTAVFSQILKKCSSQRNHWGYVADNMVPKDKHYRDAVRTFSEHLQESVESLIRFLDYPALKGVDLGELNGRACVLRTDLRQQAPLAANSIDLIVTSPPYASVTDYTTSQRLSLYWFKQNIDESKRYEVGARWKRSRRNAIEQYFQEMTLCLDNLTHCLKPGKFFCVITGESKQHSAKDRVVEQLKEIVLSKGFVLRFPKITRTYSRQRVRDRKGSANREYIFIFQKTQ